MRDGAFALIWMALLPMAAMSAMVGILLWIWVALLSPNEFLYGPLAGVQFNKLVALATIGVLMFSKERKDFYLDATAVLLLALLAFATSSWLFGLLPTDRTMDQYLKLVKELVLAGTIMCFMTSRLRIHYILVTLSLALGFFAVTEAGMFLVTGGGHKVLGIASIGDNNSLATALLMVAPMMMYLARYSEHRLVRLGFQGGVVACIVTVVATSSRGGFVGLLVLGLFVIMNSRKKLLPLLAVALAGVLVFIMAPDSWFERLNTINEASQDGSFMGRVVVWKMSILIAMDRPFVGAGPHAVQYLPVWNMYKPLLPLVNFVTTPPPSPTPFAAHSIWFEMLGDFGLPGLATFVGILLVGLASCMRIRRMARQNVEMLWAADLARMMQVTLIIYAVTGSALSMGYYEGYWIVIALVSRLNRTIKQELAAKAGLPPTAAGGSPFPARLQPGRLPQPLPQPAPRPVHAMRGDTGVPHGAGQGQMRPIH